MPKVPLEGKRFRIPSAAAFDTLIPDTYIGTSGVLMRRSLPAEVGGFDETLANSDDVDFFFRVARRYDLGYVDGVFHKRRIHSTNISSRPQAFASRFRAYSKLQDLPFSFYDRTQTGELVSRANSDVKSLQMFLAFGPMMGLTLVSFLAALVLMLKIHVMLTLVTLAVLPIVYTSASRMTKWIFPLSWLIAARQAEVATIVEENVAGTQVVKSFAAEGEQVSMVDRAAERLQWASIKLADVRAKFGPLIQNLPRLGLAVVLYYGGYLVIHEEITIGALFAFNAYVMLIQLPFMILGFVLMMAQRAAASAHWVLRCSVGATMVTAETVPRPSSSVASRSA